MGHIKHDSIIVTSFMRDHVEQARKKAVDFLNEYFDNATHFQECKHLVSEIITGLANDQYSFFIAPDGSKEGWLTSDLADQARAAFIIWITTSGLYIDYACVRFGGDDDEKSLS